MDEGGQVFAPHQGETPACNPLEAGHLDPELVRALLPFLSGKSYFGPVVRRRIVRLSMSEPQPQAPREEVTSPLLSKVSSAYNWYRREQMKLAADAMNVMTNNPELHAGLYGLSDVDLFKSAEAMPVNSKTLAVLLGAVPLTLMYSAHQRQRMKDDEMVGLLNRLVAEHPWMATIGTAAALREIMKTPQAQAAVEEMVAAGQRIWSGQSAHPIS
jgi:hypothetical protein